MSTIDVKFVASELAPGLENGQYEIEDGASVLDLLKKCEVACGVKIPEKNLQYLYTMFNGRPVRLEDELSGEGTLQFCRIVFGG